MDWFLTSSSAAPGWSSWDWIEILVWLPFAVMALLACGLFVVAQAGWRAAAAWACAVAAGAGMEALDLWAGQLTPAPSRWVWLALSAGFLAAGGFMAVVLIRVQRLAGRVAVRPGDRLG